MTGARRPFPEVPAAQHRLGVRRRAASRAHRRLGVAWVDRGDGVFDLARVPEKVREAFSSRTQQVEAKLAELVRAWSDAHDGSDPGPRTAARLERNAVLHSRPDKVHGVDAAELHAHWRAEVRAAGFEPTRHLNTPALLT